VTLLPDLVVPGRQPGVAVRDIADAPVSRAIFAVTRASDASRPSTQALVGAMRRVVGDLPQGAS
jgi:DNA-binding transcriptional LysR family regulator